jgi:hypothetical protein
MANHAPQAPKTPFVLLVLGLLGGGLVTLLLLSSASSADAFTQRRLEQENRTLGLREQDLGRQVAVLEAPGSLADRARKLGLVQGASPGFLVIGPGGTATVVGSPAPATSPPPPPTPTPKPSATPGATSGVRPTAARSGASAPAPGPTAARPDASAAAPRPTRRPSASAPAPGPTPQPTPTPGGDR